MHSINLTGDHMPENISSRWEYRFLTSCHIKTKCKILLKRGVGSEAAMGMEGAQRPVSVHVVEQRGQNPLLFVYLYLCR
jgi:hypothetical protein